MVMLLNGKYALERLLGGGGMAEVFLARTVGAEGFSRPVAIKRVLPHYSMNPHFATMFVAEAQLSSRLQHPNVVSVLDFDRDHEGGLFLVMELVDGVDLDTLLGTGMLPLPAIVHVVTEILRGLGYAHELPIGTGGTDGVRGLVHRDVSPHNVLLSWEGAAKVSDFGIAKSRAASDATATELIKGKPAYMSPEQANGQALDGRSDLFAVGVMLWEMLCGRALFAGTTTQETLARLMFAPIPSPRQLRPDLPADLERVAMRLLARERDQRYPDADAAISELLACRDHPRNGRELMVALLAQRFADRAPQRARSAGGDIAATLDTPAPVPSRAPLPTPADASLARPMGSPRRRGLLAVLGAFLVVGVGGAIAISAGDGSSATPKSAPVPVSPEPIAPAPATPLAPLGAGSSTKPGEPPISVAPPPSVPAPAAAGSGVPEATAPSRPSESTAKSNPRKRSRKGHGGSGSGSGMHEIKLGGSAN